MLSLSYPQPGTAVIAIDTPGRSVNLLDREVLDELSAILDKLEGRLPIDRLVFLSLKPSVFIAGADVRRLRDNIGRPPKEIMARSRCGQQIFARLANQPFISIAAIAGHCLGGGAELACWCDGRVAADNANSVIGFPEVKLGLIPGWGGTALLPRWIGIANAVELITSGEPIAADQAKRIGLFDELAPREDLLNAALALADRLRQGGEFQIRRQRRLDPLPISSAELDLLKENSRLKLARRPAGEREAALAALDILIAAAHESFDQTCRRESAALAARFSDPNTAAMIHVVAITTSSFSRGAPSLPATPVASSCGTPGPRASPCSSPPKSSSPLPTLPSITTIGIVGAGIMGTGIAGANLKQGLAVVLEDTNPVARVAGIQRAIDEAAYDRQIQGPDPQRAITLSARITTPDGGKPFSTCQLVIEAVVEKEHVKRLVLAQLDQQLPPATLLASNTSTFPITSLARELKHPERFCGLHFFNPVRVLKLVEVIRGAATSDETITTAMDYARRLGKIPVLVNDGPGFLVNRLLMQYMNEALALLMEGASLSEIDRAAEDFGMAMGPCAVYDLVGMDTAWFAGQTLWKAFPERVVLSPLIGAFIRAGRLGRKTGAGFFAYPNNSHSPQPDPAAESLIEQYVRSRRAFTAEEIQNRLILAMLFEAVRVLDDRVVGEPRDVDLGVLHGLGFPTHRGGLLFWSDTLGAARIIELARPLEHYGPRLQPPPPLIELARTGGKFFPR